MVVSRWNNLSSAVRNHSVYALIALTILALAAPPAMRWWSARDVVRRIIVHEAEFKNGVLILSSGTMYKRGCRLAGGPEWTWSHLGRVNYLSADYGDASQQADPSRPEISPIVNWRIYSPDPKSPLTLDSEIQGYVSHQCADLALGPALFFAATPRDILRLAGTETPVPKS